VRHASLLAGKLGLRACRVAQRGLPGVTLAGGNTSWERDDGERLSRATRYLTDDHIRVDDVF